MNKKLLSFFLGLIIILSTGFNSYASGIDEEVNSYVDNLLTVEEKESYIEAYKREFPNSFSSRSYSDLYLDYSDYFFVVYWTVKDNGEIALRIYPNDGLTSNMTGNERMAMANHAFKLIKDRFSNDYRWKNEKSLFAQFHCYVLFAGSKKVSWNIEPHRTSSNPIVVFGHRCNP